RGVEVPLTVLGDGPALTALGGPWVDVAGVADPAAVSARMRAAEVLVVPSEGWEGFPVGGAGAFAHGLPGVACRLGGLPEAGGSPRDGSPLHARRRRGPCGEGGLGRRAPGGDARVRRARAAAVRSALEPGAEPPRAARGLRRRDRRVARGGRARGRRGDGDV